MKEILEKAIAHYGKEAQLQMVVGEIGELLTLFGRESQGRASEADWLDEIADVFIMMEQLVIIKGINPIDIHLKIRDKVDRIEARIEAEECPTA